MSCNIKPSKINYYIADTADIEDFEIDQTIIARTSFLHKIPLLDYRKEEKQPERCDELYAYANSYYCHTEDSDPLSKVNSLLAQIDILQQSREREEKRRVYCYDAYSEKDAHIRYLSSTPVSFIILGKPDIGQQALGRELAKHWGCVYVEPEDLIVQEIMSGSRVGECIEFNLRCGRAIGIDIILKLVERKVKSETAKHRGFVLCGLPVIPNDLYEEDPASSESAIFTAQDIFEDLFSKTADLGRNPSNPQVSISSKYQSEQDDANQSQTAVSSGHTPSLNQSKSDVHIGKDYEKQLIFLFDLLEEPYFIIYIQCSAIDVLNKRNSYRFDPILNQLHDLQRRYYNEEYRTRLELDEDIDITDEAFDPSILSSENFRLKHLVQLPGDFCATVSSQLDQYHCVALNFIQNRVLAHNPEYYIKVDGRTSISKMLTLIKARLNVMNVQKVLVPFKLIGNEGDSFLKSGVTLSSVDTDTPRPEIEDKTDLSPEDCFKQLRTVQVPSKSYLWSWSEFGTKCPVSMKMGYLRDGTVKYAVQFMNKIYFLTDENTYQTFCDNPRPFLLPPFPRSTCKIFIFGPKRSGRTALANCLAYYFGGTVLSADTIMLEFMQQRQDEYLEKIRQQAIVEGIALLNEQRALEAEEEEKNRTENIKEWVKTIINMLENMSHILKDMELEEKKDHFEISSFPMAMKKKQTDTLEDSEYAVALTKLREELQALKFPIYELDVDTWKSYITNRRKLLQYLPADLAQKRRPKPATVFDDFVKDFVANALAQAGVHEFHLTGGELFELFMKHMKVAEEKYFETGFGCGGWIIDGMMCNLNILQQFSPDYSGDDVIVLKDSTGYLVKNYKERKSTYFNNYQNFFKHIGVYAAAMRCPSLNSDDDREGIVKNILSGILDDDSFYDEADGFNKRTEEYETLISTFNQSWEDVNKFYLERNITPIEIDVSGKSLTELFEFTIKMLNAKYSYSASPLTEEKPDIKLAPEDSEPDEEASSPTATVEFYHNIVQERKFGNALYYCPVTLTENFVLWKGREEFAVNYNAETYLLSSKADMDKFIEDPVKFLPCGYPFRVPPPRICVSGGSGSCKTHLSKLLAQNYGLAYLSFENILKNLYHVDNKSTLFELASNSSIATLRAYLNSEAALPSNILANLKMYWNDEPFKSVGFVFDDFPKTHYDIEYMVENKLIPDLIIYPEADETYLKTKILDSYMKTWQEEQEKQQEEFEAKYSKALEKWHEQRSVRFDALIEERRENRYTKKLVELPEPDVAPDLKGTSLVSFDSVADQKDIDEVNKILDLEFPPVIHTVPKKNPELFIAEMEPEISKRIQFGLVAINDIKTQATKENIELASVALDLDNIQKTVRESFLLVEPLKFRNKSYLESCYDVSLEVADRLLSSGYKFLSKFGRTCPVQYYEAQIPIQMYQVAIINKNVFPVVHRSYVYFIIGKSQSESFKKNPLKYIDQQFRLPLIRYKVAVSGPPKCGKTTLAKRIQNEFGFKLITRGQAVRYVLKNLFLSELAKNMEVVLRKGWELTNEMVIKSVEAATFNPMVITQGVVFDGFPNTLNETRHLAYVDLVPNLVVDLVADISQVLECLTAEPPKITLPKFGSGFMQHLYEEWLKDSEFFRKWFDQQYQAAVTFSISTSNWYVWSKSREYLLSTFYEINHYYKHVMDDWPLRLGNMLVTPLEFLERQSSYKTICPVCLHVAGNLVTGGDPPDRTGLVHYRSYFYWICNDHIELFLNSPDQFLPPYNQHSLPSEFPTKVSLTAIPLNVYENGSCAVCYKEKRIIIKGILSYAASFNSKVYLFDTPECLKTFLQNPNLFMFSIEFRTPTYPDLKYKELPILGMLEQYVAKYIVQGVSFLAKRRPVIPGLSISASALVGLGLFLKVKNENFSSMKRYYEEGFKLYNERRDNLLKYLDFMKNYRNPYIYYEEPLPSFALPPPSTKTQSLATMVSRIVDQCVDDMDMYLVDTDQSVDSQAGDY